MPAYPPNRLPTQLANCRRLAPSLVRAAEPAVDIVRKLSEIHKDIKKVTLQTCAPELEEGVNKVHEYRNVEDPQLCAMIAAGNHQAEGQLFRRHFDRIQRQLATQFWGNPDNEDAIQDTFIIVLRRLRNDEVRNPAGIASFLSRTAWCVQIGKIRKDARSVVRYNANLDDHEDSLDASFHGSQIHDENGVIAEVCQIIASLSWQRDRGLIFQHYVLGLDKDVVCKNLNLSARNFDGVAHRARTRTCNLVAAL